MRKKGRPAKPVPTRDDLEALMRTHTVEQIVAYYGVGKGTVYRWIDLHDLRSLTSTGK